MSKRIKDELDIHIENIPFLGIWTSGNETGASMGFKTGMSRNVHLTTYFRNGILNAHIRDTAKEPSKVWEMEMTIDELRDNFEEFKETCFKRYYWFQRYFQLNKNLLHTIGLSKDSKEFNARNLDFASLLKVAYKEDLYFKKRIRKGYSEGFRPGFIVIGEDTYFVCPINKKQMFIVNTEIEKTPMWKVPITQGIHRYLDYLDEEQILEQSERFSKDKINEIKVTLLGVLAEEGIDVEEIINNNVE
jgi:hypothetical protein